MTLPREVAPVRAQRILLIGSGGAGKSTLARELAARLALPLIHLDRHYWHPGWQPTSAAEWEAEVDRLIAEPRWVMDGNYGGTMERRMRRADAVILLDLPRWLCLWRVLRRQIRFLGRTRPELPAACPERLNLEFVSWIWTYPQRKRGPILRMLAELPAETSVVILRSAHDVRQLVATLPQGPAVPGGSTCASETG